MRVMLCVFLFVVTEAQVIGKGTNNDDYDILAKHVDVYPEPFKEPVPFGHISRAGFGDPFSPAKQPIDSLELMLRTQKDRAEAIKLLKTDKTKILFINPNIQKIFSSPKEEMLREIEMNPPEKNETELKWYDFSLQARNAMISSKYLPERKATLVTPTPIPSTGLKASSFPENSFDLPQDRLGSTNWTTCDQFAVKAIFSYKDIVDVKWTPFYVWTDLGISVSTEHSFEYPTEKVVYEYRSKYSKLLNKTVDWDQPKLLLKGISEMLLISAGTKGLFDAIVRHEIPDSIKDRPIKLPPLSLRIKIEDPYLALMHCEYHYATIMAISGNEPTIPQEMEAEAATINFTGTGRPIWRNLKAERDRLLLIHEEKFKEERDKFVIIDEPWPPVIGQWDVENMN